MKVVCAVLLLVFPGAMLSGFARGEPPDRYEAAGIEDAAAAERFFRRLQTAVARNERAEVAGMVAYPLRVRVDGRTVVLRNKADLLRRYSQVFNRRVRQALAGQKADRLFVNWQGVMIGNGQIWFNQQPGGRAFRIIAMDN